MEKFMMGITLKGKILNNGQDEAQTYLMLLIEYKPESEIGLGGQS